MTARLGGGLAEAGARSVGRWLVSPGAAVAGFHVMGQSVAVAYVLDNGEDRRRTLAGLGAVVRLDLLDVLLALPLGLPVPVRSLSRREASLIADLPTGCVEVAEDQVIRRAVPPLRVEVAVGAARDWRKGLDRLSSLVPFCSSVLALAKAPEDRDDLMTEAAFCGIGVVVAAPEWRVLVKPEPFVKRFHKPAGWWFAEETYRQVKLADDPRQL
jgi:hypothetical protein